MAQHASVMAAFLLHSNVSVILARVRETHKCHKQSVSLHSVSGWPSPWSQGTSHLTNASPRQTMSFAHVPIVLPNHRAHLRLEFALQVMARNDTFWKIFFICDHPWLNQPYCAQNHFWVRATITNYDLWTTDPAKFRSLAHVVLEIWALDRLY